MSRKDISKEGLRTLQSIQHAAARTGEWPVFDYVLRELARRGISISEEDLLGLRGDFLLFESPLRVGGVLRLTAQGWDQADPDSILIHEGLVSAIRRCVERVRNDEPVSPTQPRELLVEARELWKPRAGIELASIGLLLEVLGFGELTWDRLDTKSPFRIKLDPLEVLPYASVGCFADFIVISGDGPAPLQEAA